MLNLEDNQEKTRMDDQWPLVVHWVPEKKVLRQMGVQEVHWEVLSGSAPRE